MTLAEKLVLDSPDEPIFQTPTRFTKDECPTSDPLTDQDEIEEDINEQDVLKEVENTIEYLEEPVVSQETNFTEISNCDEFVPITPTGLIPDERATFSPPSENKKAEEEPDMATLQEVDITVEGLEDRLARQKERLS